MREFRGAGTFPATSIELSRLFTAVRRGKVVSVTGRFREPRSLLVREIGQRLACNFYDGVAVVSVDHRFGVRDLTAALGCVPGMPFLPYGTSNAASWLAERDMLLVLDGCDHLAAETLGWLRDLLAVAPGLRILAAGRHPLAIAPGRVHRL
ncbi:hypothetical protein OTB20_20820 [Streptomyces sp. H27-H1]|uniref:hypothetical protein n=1 Tax=Streptomyces sp. H27-H1 TaxID=2996461 RepID=UPI00226EDF58|nr:hypothetical protein [Streptomyces sp. H27-H1]MCY0928602.1 hypothetical protein [Streptomyces sp. H27-H1]